MPRTVQGFSFLATQAVGKQEARHRRIGEQFIAGHMRASTPDAVTDRFAIDAETIGKTLFAPRLPHGRGTSCPLWCRPVAQASVRKERQSLGLSLDAVSELTLIGRGVVVAD